MYSEYISPHQKLEKLYFAPARAENIVFYLSCIQVLILRHLEPHGPNLKHNPMHVGEDRFYVKTGVSRQLRDMNTDKIRATEPTDMKLTFSERKFKDLSENVYSYPLMYSC